MKRILYAFVALVLLFTSGSIIAQKNPKIENNKDLINAYTDDFINQQDIAAFENYFATDLIFHNTDGDVNYEQQKEFLRAVFIAFPDLHEMSDVLIAEGDQVARVYNAKGTFKEEFMGIPPTGKQVVVKGIQVFRIFEGKIAEVWSSSDDLGMMQQLGVIPPMGE
jgi:steroid delta-isomerase-like uncharacterized protein